MKTNNIFFKKVMAIVLSVGIATLNIKLGLNQKAYAATTSQENGFSVDYPAGVGDPYATETLNITEVGTYTVKMIEGGANSTSHVISVDTSGGDVELNLQKVNIASTSVSPISVTGNGKLKLVLSGENVLSSTVNSVPAISLGDGSSLEIADCVEKGGSIKLSCSDKNTSCIYGYDSENDLYLGSVTISSGSIQTSKKNPLSEYDGPGGIKAETVMFSGGKSTVYGGVEAGDNIEVSGNDTEVTLVGGQFQCGLNATNIAISGGTVNATGYAAGINAESKVAITGGTVRASSYDGPYGESAPGVRAGEVVIEGATVTSEAGYMGYGLEADTVKVDSGTLTAKGASSYEVDANDVSGTKHQVYYAGCKAETAVTINGGSCKFSTESGKEGNAVNLNPKNDAGKELQLLVLDNTAGETTVTVGTETYTLGSAHSDTDKNCYLWVDVAVLNTAGSEVILNGRTYSNLVDADGNLKKVFTPTISGLKSGGYDGTEKNEELSVGLDIDLEINKTWSVTPVNPDASGVSFQNETQGLLVFDNPDLGEYEINVTCTAEGYCTVKVAATIKVLQKQEDILFDGLNDSYDYGSEPVELKVIGGSVAGGAVTYTSSKTDTASVNEEGKLVFHKAGSFTLTATKAGDDTYAEAITTKDIKVNKATVELKLTGLEESYYYGTTGIKAEATGSITDGTLTYVSSDTSVAEVDNEGNVTLKGVGQFTITATLKDDACYCGEVTSKTITVEVDKSSWGKMHESGGHVYYVDDEGTTSAEITKTYGCTYLYEESDGLGAWYGIQNAVFKVGSRFHVRWLGEKSDSKEWQDYYDQLDQEHKDALAGGKIWFFLVGVTDPDGNKYEKFIGADGKEMAVRLYVEKGPEWTADNIHSVYVTADKDEIVAVEYVPTLESFEGKEFYALSIKHFSPYVVFEKADTSSDSDSGDSNAISNGDVTLVSPGSPDSSSGGGTAGGSSGGANVVTVASSGSGADEDEDLELYDDDDDGYFTSSQGGIATGDVETYRFVLLALLASVVSGGIITATKRKRRIN